MPGETKENDKENLSDETEDESQEDSNKDQDSDVSFQEEADEEIDATQNEEDWVEFIKRSTKEAGSTYEKTQTTMLDWGTQKDKMENGTKDHYFTSEKMEQKSFRMATWTWYNSSYQKISR